MTAPGHDGIRAYVAYGQILLYFEAARIQQRRITRLFKQHDRYISRLVRGDDLSRSPQPRRKTFNQNLYRDSLLLHHMEHDTTDVQGLE